LSSLGTLRLNLKSSQRSEDSTSDLVKPWPGAGEIRFKYQDTFGPEMRARMVRFRESKWVKNMLCTESKVKEGNHCNGIRKRESGASLDDGREWIWSEAIMSNNTKRAVQVDFRRSAIRCCRRRRRRRSHDRLMR